MQERNHNDFRENLSFAQEGEREIASVLEKKFKDIKVKDFVCNKDGDIVAECDGREYLFEVKEDVRAADTGNVVVEYQSWGKPSGIQTTKADYWIFRIHTLQGAVNNYLISTKKLRKLVTGNCYKFRKQMRHTDSKNKLLFFDRDYLIGECLKL